MEICILMLLCAGGAADMPFKVQRESDNGVIQARALPNGLLDIDHLQQFAETPTAVLSCIRARQGASRGALLGVA